MKQQKTPRMILTEELSHHQTLILMATVTAFGFSAWYWTSLPTHGFTRFDAPAIFAALLGLCFVATYEFTKLMAAKKGHSNRFFFAFVAFSILTGVGTHMHSEQGATEEKMQKSSVFNTSLKNIESADAQSREYAYAANYDVAALEKERDAKVAALLQQEALKADGKPSGNTVGAVISKGWKSYAQYKVQLDDLKKSYNDKIAAKNGYDSATKARINSEGQATGIDATETAEASWLIQIIGAILGIFGVSNKSNAWSAFALYLFATVILEMTVRFNGKQIGMIRKKLYGFDPDDIENMDLRENLIEQTEQSPAPAPQPASEPAQQPAETDEPEEADGIDPPVVDLTRERFFKLIYMEARSQILNGDIQPTVPAVTQSVTDTIRQHTQVLGLQPTLLGKPEREKIARKILEKMAMEQIIMPTKNGWELASRWKSAAAPSIIMPESAPRQRRADFDYTPAPAASASIIADAVAEQPVVEAIAVPAPAPELEQPRRPIGFGYPSRLQAGLDDTPTPTRVEPVHTPPSNPVSNRVDTVQHAPCNRVDTVQHGQTDTGSNTVNTPDIAPQQTDASTVTNAIAIIWKGIDNGAINRISVRDSSQCQTALRGHNIGKNNPHRRTILAVVFDALAKEGVLTRNPEYTDSNSGKPEWLINTSRSIKYAA